MLVDANLKEVRAPFLIDDIQHPPNIEAAWTDAELAAIGLFRVRDDGAPQGHHIVSSSVARDANGRVVMVHETKPGYTGPEVVSAKGFFHAFAHQERLTEDDAVFAANGDVPDIVKKFVDTMSREEQFAFRMAMSFDNDVPRTGNIPDVFQKAYGMKDDEMDEVFRLAASL